MINQIEPYITKKEAIAVEKYITSGRWLTEYKETSEFEKKIADFIGVKYAIVVPSGTVALYLSLLSIGVGAGDVVIVPNYTMIATVNAVKWTGADPLVCDINSESLCMDLDTILEPVNNLKAVIHVSINGRSGNMQDVVNYCNKKKIALIEDSAQAMGSRFGGKYLGTFGELGIYSFTPHKIITTGQGGVIVTNSSDYNAIVRSLKDFSRTKPGEDIHTGIGFNFKFTDIQSVIGIEQLKTIDYRINRKKEIYRLYHEELKDNNCIKFVNTDLNQTTPWAIDILLNSEKTRCNLSKYLLKNGIGSRSFYPPINWQKPYSYIKRGTFPVSESIVNCGLWLPSSVGLKHDDVLFICKKINQYFQ